MRSGDLKVNGSVRSTVTIVGGCVGYNEAAADPGCTVEPHIDIEVVHGELPSGVRAEVLPFRFNYGITGRPAGDFTDRCCPVAGRTGRDNVGIALLRTDRWRTYS